MSGIFGGGIDTFSGRLAHMQDRKTAGTHAGTFTSGAWRVRDLNTLLTNQIPGASAGTNGLILPAGTYFAFATAPAAAVNRHKTRLVGDVAGTLLIGTTEVCGATDNITTRSILAGRFTLAAQNLVQVHHQCMTTVATFGFGLTANMTDADVQTDLMVWKVG